MTKYIKNPTTNEIKKVPQGYSWTTLLFGIFVPYFRFDGYSIVIDLVIIFACLMFILPAAPAVLFIYFIGKSFVYNKRYERRLFMKGFTDIVEIP